jgi:hypothetical protein
VVAERVAVAVEKVGGLDRVRHRGQRHLGAAAHQDLVDAALIRTTQRFAGVGQADGRDEALVLGRVGLGIGVQVEVAADDHGAAGRVGVDERRELRHPRTAERVVLRIAARFRVQIVDVDRTADRQHHADHAEALERQTVGGALEAAAPALAGDVVEAEAREGVQPVAEKRLRPIGIHVERVRRRHRLVGMLAAGDEDLVVDAQRRERIRVGRLPGLLHEHQVVGVQARRDQRCVGFGMRTRDALRQTGDVVGEGQQAAARDGRRHRRRGRHAQQVRLLQLALSAAQGVGHLHVHRRGELVGLDLVTGEVLARVLRRLPVDARRAAEHRRLLHVDVAAAAELVLEQRDGGPGELGLLEVLGLVAEEIAGRADRRREQNERQRRDESNPHASPWRQA